MLVLSFAKKLPIVSLILILTVPDVNAPGLTLCLAKLIDECKWRYLYTYLAKNM